MSTPRDRVLVVDTETTGLAPRYADPRNAKAWDVCRMVQMAWQLHEQDGTLVEAAAYIVQPDGFEVPPVAARIHGITTEIAEQDGVPIQTVWEHLARILPSVGVVVAHNLSFDDGVIRSEMCRSAPPELRDMWAIDIPKRYCTMLRGTEPGKKWPKLAELYERCFGEPPKGTLHRADVDTAACARIYFHLTLTGQRV